MERKIEAAIGKAHKNISSEAGHNECVNKVASELHDAGVHFERERPLMCGGNKCKPDLTVVDQREGKNLAHIEVKCKGKIDQGDRAQAEKYQNAEEAPVFLANVKGDKPEPNVRKFD